MFAYQAEQLILLRTHSEFLYDTAVQFTLKSPPPPLPHTPTPGIPLPSWVGGQAGERADGRVDGWEKGTLKSP